jgi:hypothetical protein
MIQLGDSRFVVPIATGLTPMWYTVPLSAPAGITRVNYMTMGITGGNQAAVLNVYITPLAMNLRADVPTLVLTYNIAAATRTSRVALGYDLLFYGGDYALIWEFTYSVAPATPLFGPCAAISPEVPMRLMSANSGAFNAAQGVNFDGTAAAGYNNAALFTASTFPYGLPWCELYYCLIAAGEPVPPGEGGGGVPPVPTYTFAPAKLVAVL